MKTFVTIILLLLVTPLVGQPHKTENLVIVTLDGFRWQELFLGADSSLVFDPEYTHDCTIAEKFWSDSLQIRRAKLLPFLWSAVADSGQLYGNRRLNNRVDCSNQFWFSYPGYSELFTGLVDPRVRSNRKIINPSPTIFEHINEQQNFKGGVAVFSTWDVIPYVIRAQDARIPANSGGTEARTEAERLGQLFLADDRHSFKDPYPYSGDLSTFFSAFEFLKKERPKVLYLSLDETDASAHGGNYGAYLRAAHHADAMIAELWKWIQADWQYRDKTTLLITTDHGRGSKTSASWKRHGRLTAGSGQVWFAVIGPDTPATGEMKTDSRYFQKQFAKTAAGFLGIDFTNTRPVGDKIHTMYLVREITTR